MIHKLGRAFLVLAIPLALFGVTRLEDFVPSLPQVKAIPSNHNEIPVQINISKPIRLEYSKWNVLLDESLVHEGNKHYERNYNLSINNAAVCANLRNNSLSFAVVIETDLLNFERRDFIRKTWGLKILQSLANFKVIFLVGLRNDHELQGKLEYENSIYGDIVQIQVDEHFSNLTYKSISMLKWYLDYCPQADYLIKTDDDIYLHIPNIVRLFNELQASPNQSSLVCHKNKSRRIIRNVTESHKYVPQNHNISIDKIHKKFSKYILKGDIPGKYYPEYCSGFIYTMNVGVAKKLFETSKTIPIVNIEDVFITGFSRQKSNVGIVDNVNFRLNPIIYPIEGKCIFDGGRITSNEMTLKDLNSLWLHVNTNGYYCKYSQPKTT